MAKKQQPLPKGNKKVQKVMGEYKRKTLHAGVDPKGPKKAPVVKSKKQAIAIALSEQRKSEGKKK